MILFDSSRDVNISSPSKSIDEGDKSSLLNLLFNSTKFSRLFNAAFVLLGILSFKCKVLAICINPS